MFCLRLEKGREKRERERESVMHTRKGEILAGTSGDFKRRPNAVLEIPVVVFILYAGEGSSSQRQTVCG
jgi:hypothetical protein